MSFKNLLIQNLLFTLESKQTILAPVLLLKSSSNDQSSSRPKLKSILVSSSAFSGIQYPPSLDLPNLTSFVLKFVNKNFMVNKNINKKIDNTFN